MLIRCLRTLSRAPTTPCPPAWRRWPGAAATTITTMSSTTQQSAGITAAADQPLSSSVGAVAAVAPAAAAPGTFPRRPAAVLFDIDGTLTDSDCLHAVTFQELLLEMDFRTPDPSHMAPHPDGSGRQIISEEFFRLHISGKCNATIAAEMFPEWTPERGRAFGVRKEALFRTKAASLLKPLQGLDALLRRLQASGVPVAAVTNAPRVNAEFMLECIGKTSVFQECLVIGEECSHTKPHPAPYLRAAKVLGVDPRECVVFEDSPGGVRAGVAAGCFVIGVTTSQPPAYLRDVGGAHATVADFSDPRLAAWFEEGGDGEDVATAAAAPTTATATAATATATATAGVER